VGKVKRWARVALIAVLVAGCGAPAGAEPGDVPAGEEAPTFPPALGPWDAPDEPPCPNPYGWLLDAATVDWVCYSPEYAELARVDNPALENMLAAARNVTSSDQCDQDRFPGLQWSYLGIRCTLPGGPIYVK
jgi:hypothetical protein